MKVKFRLNAKLLVYILSTTAILFLVAIGFVVTKMRTISFNAAEEYVETLAKEKAMLVRSELNMEMDISRAIAQSFSNFKDLSIREIEKFHGGLLYEITKQNDNFLSVWMQWDYKIIDPKWKREGGRFRLIYYREDDKIKEIVEVVDTSLNFNRTAYYDIRLDPKEHVMAPYWFSYKGEDPKLVTSVVVPVIVDGEHFGQAGIDMQLQRFQKLIQEIKPYKIGYASLLANDGAFIYHPNEKNIGKKIHDKDIELDSISKAELIKNIDTKEPFSYFSIENNQRTFNTCVPFYIGKSDTPWLINLSIPIELILQEAKKAYRRSISIGIFGFGILALIIWFIAHSITKPLRRATKVVSFLSEGVIDTSNKLKVTTSDEVGDISNGVNKLIDGLNRTANFANEIGKGNLKSDYQLLSENDVLGKALLEMRKSLEVAQEQEQKRKFEDYKMNWANEGLARFSELLRDDSDNIEELSYKLISNIIKYINANLGGIFIINDDDPNNKFLQLHASFAYDRRKYIDKKIHLEEGLVGRCVQEGETIYMTDVPKDYIKIQSGLGDENPQAILLVPLKLNDEVYGVIEIASFEEIEEYKIKFIERIGESIASTISTVRINIRTKRLLEETRQQSEELASQEEEMRQNMEELQATQEEAARKSAEMESLLNALNSTSYVAEYDLSGNLTYINDSYANLQGEPKSAIIGTHHTDNMDFTNEQKRNYNNFWNAILSGKIQKQRINIILKGKKYSLMETYTPIYNENGEVYKVLKIANNISEFVEKK